jgi:hypothetical protein
VNNVLDRELYERRDSGEARLFSTADLACSRSGKHNTAFGERRRDFFIVGGLHTRNRINGSCLRQEQAGWVPTWRPFHESKVTQRDFILIRRGCPSHHGAWRHSGRTSTARERRANSDALVWPAHLACPSRALRCACANRVRALAGNDSPLGRI